MKLRHTAALALVSWYLMLPPTLHYDPDKVDQSAPLSQWQVMSSYDSADACAAEKTRLEQVRLLGGGNNSTRVAQCVASDDPQLKQK